MSPQRTTPGVPAASLQFLNAHLGFMLLTFSQSGKPRLYRTLDGGNHWQIRSLPVRASFANGANLTFVDANHGWLMADRSAGTGNEWLSIYRTTDGGKRWAKVAATGRYGTSPSGLRAYGMKNDLVFMNSSVGWLTGQNNSDGVEIYRTRDGGRYWILQRLPPLPRAITHGSVSQISYSPTFFTRTDGVLPIAAYVPKGPATAGTGGTWRLFLYSTHDSGIHWINPTEVTGCCGSIHLVNRLDWWIVGTTSVSVSSNGGHTWQRHELSLPHNLSVDQSQIINLRSAWLLTTGATADGRPIGNELLLTRDSGAEWVHVHTPHLPVP